MNIVVPSTNEIELKYDDGHMTFNIREVVQNTPISQYRKILSYILKHAWQVQQPNYIDAINAWHDYTVALKKAAWDEASIEYQREWKLWDQGHVVDGRTVPYTKKEVISIKAENKRLLQRVKSAKYQYGLFLDRTKVWKELREKYSN